MNEPFDDGALAKIRTDDDARADVETLSERDDNLGAFARVVLAIADGRRPDPEDCEQANVPSVAELSERAPARPDGDERGGVA